MHNYVATRILDPVRLFTETASVLSYPNKTKFFFNQVKKKDRLVQDKMTIPS